jgi:hypothetical protein
MPNRIIKESAFTSDRIAQLSDFEFRLWVGLITQADDAGRGDARPAILKGRVFALRERVALKDIDSALHALAAAGCVSLYTVGGKPYYAFPNWAKHLRVYNTKTRTPGPEEADAGDGEHCSPLRQERHDCGDLPQAAADFRLNLNPNPNPNPNPETMRAGARGAEFERFWSVYPKKVGKKDAERAFEKAIKGMRDDGHTASSSPTDRMIAAVERQKCSEQWLKEGGRYIPNPATWLNQGRWEDELPAAKGNGYLRHDQSLGPEMQAAVDRMLERMEE